jgi:hypothetical protein
MADTQATWEKEKHLGTALLIIDQYGAKVETIRPNHFHSGRRTVCRPLLLCVDEAISRFLGQDAIHIRHIQKMSMKIIGG